jgi:3-isopropylmalate/(R)-2-methylmalate dehydratase small subunit
MNVATGMVRTGRVWKFGENINTDLILPSKAFALPHDQMHRFAFEAIRPGWVDMVQKGDLIVGGENFGMGSSRPVGAVLHRCGIAGVIADSINGLCLRNCINASIPAASCPGVSAMFEDGDTARIEFLTGVIENVTKRTSITTRPLAPLLAELVEAGGIIPMLVAEGYVEKQPFVAATL